MFPRLLGGLSLAVLAALSVYFLFFRANPRDTLVAAMEAALSETEGFATSVTLDQCDLQIDRRGVAPASQSLSIARLRANLTDYHTHSVNLRPLNDGRMVLTLQRKSLSEASVQNGVQLLRHLPPAMDTPDPNTLTLMPENGLTTKIRPLAQPASKMSRADVETLLRQPNGTLSFRLGVLIPENPEDIKPHKDAPAFHQFAHAVLADAALREYSVQLAYLGSDAVAEALLIGGLVAPPDVQFVLPSEEDAKALAQVLLRYVSKTCRRS